MDSKIQISNHRCRKLQIVADRWHSFPEISSETVGGKIQKVKWFIPYKYELARKDLRLVKLESNGIEK
jgi:hypothetical protein